LHAKSNCEMTEDMTHPVDQTDLGSNPYLGFSSTILMKLEQSRTMLDEYVQKQKNQIDALAEEYQHVVAKEQEEIDQLTEQLRTVQLKRGSQGEMSEESVAHKRSEMKDKRKSLEQEVQELTQEREDLEQKLNAIKEVENTERIRAEEFREKKLEVERLKKISVEDLTHGILNYKSLGLDFQKGLQDRLRVSFSKLDPSDQKRMFSFSLNIDENENYIVEECAPELSEQVVEELLDALNQSQSDFPPFLLGMRTEFEKVVSS